MKDELKSELFADRPVDEQLYDLLNEIEDQCDLADAIPFYEFPLYNDDNHIYSSKFTILSPRHGVLVFGTTDARDARGSDLLRLQDDHLDQVASLIQGRLIRNKALRSGRQQLAIPIVTAIFAPNYKATPPDDLFASILVANENVSEFLDNSQVERIDETTFAELEATLEGARGLSRPKTRPSSDFEEHPKGFLVSKLESVIASFDAKQRQGMIAPIKKPQRIRGLAGSGKTVVLAMKAALTHLRYPKATILYTFYTKSLYQHIKRLITRFYRQFDDRDPDWDRIQVMHAWGGRYNPGVYSTACERLRIRPLTFEQAKQNNRDDPFAFVCEDLLARGKPPSMFDYVLVDEGQDFPPSFLKLAYMLSSEQRFVYAYDDLQTIFQVQATSPKDFLDASVEYDDIVLFKCYRNPREVIVCAHALGFGLYGPSIVQMLENNEQWEDVGYVVREGAPKPGENYVIERPPEYSIGVLSESQSIDEIIQVTVCKNASAEVKHVVDSVVKDLQEGLRPDDILIEVVDDRNAKVYLNAIEKLLDERDIASHNVHAKAFGVMDFVEDNCVTLSTVHKAKGNEAYMVYVVGVDALFAPDDVRNRNVLFTSMTRAKGWLRISGVGNLAKQCKKEIDAAKRHYPNIVFEYPSEGQMKIIRRDLKEAASAKAAFEKLLDQLEASGLSEAEIEALLQRAKYAKKSIRSTRVKKTKK